MQLWYWAENHISLSRIWLRLHLIERFLDSALGRLVVNFSRFCENLSGVKLEFSGSPLALRLPQSSRIV
jgi:hypothetical protein